MKIAIPSDDRVSIATHFGRVRGFAVYDVTDGKAVADGYRATTSKPKHECACGTAERASTHQAFLDILDGCSIVIARGMGAHMYDDLVSCGIHVFLTETPTVQTAVEQYIAHSLPERPGLGCVDHVECEEHHR